MADVVQLPRLRPHFSDLTTGKLNGEGLFDELMGSVKGHLMEEFNAQRLRGTDYSKVYLGTMEATLSNAVQYLLGVSLIDAQLKKIEAEIDLVHVQIQKEKELLPLQISKIDAETRGIEAQIRLTEAQIEREKLLLPAQKAQIEAETERTKAQTDQIREQIALMPYEIKKIEADIKATEAQILKLEKDKALVDAQVRELEYRVQYMLPMEKDILQSQKEKTAQEVLLIQAKTLTEQKNLLVLDKQIVLLQEQAAAYQKEIDVKKTKVQVDAWAAKAVADGSGAGGPASWIG